MLCSFLQLVHIAPFIWTSFSFAPRHFPLQTSNLIDLDNVYSPSYCQLENNFFKPFQISTPKQRQRFCFDHHIPDFKHLTYSWLTKKYRVNYKMKTCCNPVCLTPCRAMSVSPVRSITFLLLSNTLQVGYYSTCLPL